VGESDTRALVPYGDGGGFDLTSAPGGSLPALVAAAGPRAKKRFVEFFAAEIRNPKTRRAYAFAVRRFTDWCEARGFALERIEPVIVAAYVEGLQKELAAPSVKQHLAAIRRLFDYLATGGVLPGNPASSVRGPKHVVKVGKTPVLTEEEARTLFDSIDTGTVVGLRDRAFLAVMTYSFARVGAVVKMEVRDYYTQGKRSWFRLHEKGGKYHQVPVHHRAGEYVDAYLEAAEILAEARSPFFRTSLARTGRLTANALTENAALRIVKRRAAAAGLPREICCHTFRATGITSYLLNGGEVSKAQKIANHESPRTTELYNRTQDEVTLDEIERIRI
jgi:site-specific recombinase XerD